MKKKHQSITIPGVVLSSFLAVLLKILFLANIAFAFVKADLIVLDTGIFTENVNGHVYKCYSIKDDPSSIAIAWGESPELSPEDHLALPETITSDKLTGESVEYTVKAIAKKGFSHCVFKTIEIPQSVVKIEEEAFSYCQNLTNFQFPKDITEIASSTFMDCRSLTTVAYSSESGKRTFSNNKIISIGDHAFDSCIELKKFNCPNTAIFFGESCFQHCDRLTIFRFPYDNGLEGEEHNDITIKAYAFADCQSLDRITFDINMKKIEDHAFADTNPGLQLHFHGTEEQFDNMEYAELWRNKYITTADDYKNQVYPIEFNTPKDYSADGYPGLYYDITSDDQYLDNNRRWLVEEAYKTDVKVIAGSSPYAIITNFTIPEEDEWFDEYYNDGNLIIPDCISKNGTDYLVKVIAAQAFASLSEEDAAKIKSITFNENLVQIQNRAFFGLTSIESLNFSKCTELKEISYSIFNEPVLKDKKSLDNFINSDMDGKGIFITSLHSVTLPNCLEYLGNFAFYNFTNLYEGISFKTNPSKPSKLKVIGDYAFAVHQDYDYTPSECKVDIILPYSLDDAEAKKAKVYHALSYDRKNGYDKDQATVHDSMKDRWSAINKNAFDNQRVIRTVTMEEDSNDTTGHETSLATNAFGRCINLLRFESNKNICLIGKDALGAKSNTPSNLREVFLQADRANSNSINASVPWNINDGNNKAAPSADKLFSKSSFKELVIYIKSSTGKLPKEEDPAHINEKIASYPNDLTGATRTRIPYYFVDWTETGNIKYWHLNSTTNSLVDFENGPKTLDDYNSGFISLVKNSESNYTVANYFTDATDAHKQDTVDLTSNTLSGITIDTIGEEAFGSENKVKSRYFILPTTITTIKERAFYRKTSGNGIRILTFKKSDGASPYINSAYSGSAFEQCANKDSGKFFCALPDELTKIEKNAFYNNEFKQVEIGTKLSFLGENAFYAHGDSRGTITSFAFTNYEGTTTNQYFTAINGGIYYTKESNKKMLVQQTTGVAENITIDTGTKAIGYYAAANSRITSVTFNDDCTTIYGKAFINCKGLTSLINIDNIQYIATSDQNFYNTDRVGKYENKNSSFEGCSNLKVNFSEMTSLKKIGSSAFKSCSTLVNKEFGKTYEFYTTSESGSAVTKTSNVLDLSTLSGNLRSLGGACFQGCGIEYAILPNTTGNEHKAESNFYCTEGTKIFDGAVIKLVGETAYQASELGGNGTTAKNHYSLGAFELGTMSNYANVYYRVHGAEDLSSYEGGNSYLKYWTAIKSRDPDKVKIILFETKDDANTWLTASGNIDKILASFPETPAP